MNCKLEKFWNMLSVAENSDSLEMNCKLEKFWNPIFLSINSELWLIWTVNLKSFEMK